MTDASGSTTARAPFAAWADDEEPGGCGVHRFDVDVTVREVLHEGHLDAFADSLTRSKLLDGPATSANLADRRLSTTTHVRGRYVEDDSPDEVASRVLLVVLDAVAECELSYVSATIRPGG